MRAAVLGLFVALGCDRGHHREDPPATTPVVTEPPPVAPGCTLAPIASHYPAPKRLVAIGDLHGDLGGTRAALRAAGAIDEHDHWAGGGLVVVQTGDALDRGDDERAILELLERLTAEAAAAGGALIQLIGNHELMNAAGDFRYVTAGGFRDFTDGQTAGKQARMAALGPGGSYAKRIAKLGVIAIVGDTVFSHAGVLGEWATRVDEVNQAARCWLDGQGREQDGSLAAEDSPVWTRAYGAEQVDCAALDATLARLHAARMVVAHTVQPHGISSACDGKLWRIDVGLAKLYDGPIEVLELTPDAPPRVLTGRRS